MSEVTPSKVVGSSSIDSTDQTEATKIQGTFATLDCSLAPNRTKLHSSSANNTNTKKPLNTFTVSTYLETTVKEEIIFKCYAYHVKKQLKLIKTDTASSKEICKCYFELYSAAKHKYKYLFTYEKQTNSTNDADYIIFKLAGVFEKKVSCKDIDDALFVLLDTLKCQFASRFEDGGTIDDSSSDSDSDLVISEIYYKNKFDQTTIAIIDFVANFKLLFSSEYYNDLFEKGHLLNVLGQNRATIAFSYLFNHPAFPININNKITNIPEWLAKNKRLYCGYDNNTQELFIHALRHTENMEPRIVDDNNIPITKELIHQILSVNSKAGHAPSQNKKVILYILKKADADIFLNIPWNSNALYIIFHNSLGILNYIYSLSDEVEKKNNLLILTKLLNAFDYKQYGGLLEPSVSPRMEEFLTDYLINTLDLRFDDKQEQIDYFFANTVIPCLSSYYIDNGSSFSDVKQQQLDHILTKLDSISIQSFSLFTLEENNFLFNKIYVFVEKMGNKNQQEKIISIYNNYLNLPYIKHIIDNNPQISIQLNCKNREYCLLINKELAVIMSNTNLIELTNNNYNFNRKWHDIIVIDTNNAIEINATNIANVYSNFVYLNKQYLQDKYRDGVINLIAYTVGEDYKNLFYQAINAVASTKKLTTTDKQNLDQQLKKFTQVVTVPTDFGIDTIVSDEFVDKFKELFELQTKSTKDLAKYLYSYAYILLEITSSKILKDYNLPLFAIQQLFMQILHKAYLLDNKVINNNSFIMKKKVAGLLQEVMAKSWQDTYIVGCNYNYLDKIKSDAVEDLLKAKMQQIMTRKYFNFFRLM